MTKMTRRLSVLMLLVLLCLSYGSIVMQAQEDALDEDEQAALEYVMQAMENMSQLDTLRVAVEQTINQTFTAEGVTVDMVIAQLINGAYDNSSDEIRFEVTNEQDLTTEVDGQEDSLEMTMDMVAVDDVLWVRVIDVIPESLGAIFPSEWTNVSEEPTLVPGLEMLNVSQLLQMTNSWEAYPLSEESVASIEELDADELDGREMRVFVVCYNSQALLETGLADQIGQMFNAEVMGADMESMMRQIIEGATLEMTAWIDTEDVLLYRAEVHMVVDAEIEDVFPGMDVIGVQQDLNARYDYHSFNEPLEITAPEAGE